MKKVMLTLNDIYSEMVRTILTSNLEIDKETIAFAEGLEERFLYGESISLSELQWLNRTIEKYGLG